MAKAKVLGFPLKSEKELAIEQVENEFRELIKKTLECRIKYEKVTGRQISWEILGDLTKSDDVPF